jgi:Arc-like DNA binding domain
MQSMTQPAPASLKIRMTERLREAIEEAAGRNGCSLNAEITRRLTDSFLRLAHSDLIEAGGQIIRAMAALNGLQRDAGALARDLQDDKDRARAVELLLGINALQGELFAPLQTLLPRSDQGSSK